MKKELDRNLESCLLVAVLGGVIIGFVLGWCWANGWAAALNIRFVELLAAVGTVGAVIVALGLHRENVARIKQTELRRATLYAVEMRVPLQYFRNLAKALTDLNLRCSQGGLSQLDLERLLSTAREVSGFERVKAMDFARIDCLSPTMAAHLAAGITQLAQGALAVLSMATLLDRSHLEQVRNHILQSHVILGGGFDVFDRGYTELSNHALDAVFQASR